MSAPTEGQILDDVALLLGDFHGREYSGPIGPQTRFFADLGLALGRRTDRDLTIGELVAFLRRSLEK